MGRESIQISEGFITVSGVEFLNGTIETDINFPQARFVQRSEGMNTVIAKVDVTAKKTMQKQVVFGYSDFVWIYVNGKQIYGGRNDFRSRDYRYLGTIGLFDSVYLPLNEGNNEVLFVVGENLGGWGLKAHMPDQEGIEIKGNEN